MAKALIGVYPGSYDPITNGHIDIIRRGTKLVDTLIVAIAVNTGKQPLFTLDERLAIVKEEIAAENEGLSSKVEVRSLDGLLLNFVRAVGGSIIIRGLRAVSDFDFEFQMTGMNARLDPGIETVFLMASETHQFISSRLVKEIGSLGGDVTPFVSPRVATRLKARYAEEATRRRRNASRSAIKRAK